MTDPTDRDQRDPEEPTTETTASSAEDQPDTRTRKRRSSGSRTRTRTRDRGDDRSADERDQPSARNRSSDDRGDAGASGARDDAAGRDSGDGGGRGSDDGDGGGGDDDGDGQGSGGSGRKRRRRGRRGRGRGKGRGGQERSGETGSSSGADDAAAEGGDAAATGGRSSRGGRGGGDGSGKDRGEDRDEAAVEAAMAKGGTRLAAKRGRRGGNGGGGNRRPQRVGGVSEEVRRAILEGPPRTMLVTAREDRTQIAVLEDRTVVEHYVTRKEDVTYVGNIYMARVQNVLPGMEAAFLDIGKGRNGVLYAGEVLYDELDLEEGAEERIENVLKPGQKVLVQVTKDPMGSKGPRLTMHLSLAGRYMVLAPNSDLFGISRKLTDRERDRLRKVVKRVKPSEHGVIVRTAAEGATDDQLTADLERLLAKWARVEERAAEAKALTTVYEEPPLVVKVIRDNFGPEFERCIVDDEELYEQVLDYLEAVAPELSSKVELYGAPTTDARSKAAGAPAADGEPPAADADADPAGGSRTDGEEPQADPAADERSEQQRTTDRAVEASETSESDAGDGDDRAETDDEGADAEASGGGGSDGGARDGAAGAADARPTVDVEAARARRAELPTLFDAYDVSDQLRKAMGKKVWLPSGGYLIIETTEAMKVIDVNTGKFTGGSDTNLEEVVLKTNLEAADEIVRQLRLRDMGGIIIIDFIDMLLKSNQEQVVRRLKRELLRDRTKTRVSEVSKLGLVQMTRKNVSQGLVESFSHTCPKCEGRGLISELG